VPVRGIVAPSSRAFATPLGDVVIDVDAVGSLRDAGLVTIDDIPHAPEHALEVELPFLQSVLEDHSWPERCLRFQRAERRTLCRIAVRLDGDAPRFT